jgi:hypothetical protein
VPAAKAVRKRRPAKEDDETDEKPAPPRRAAADEDEEDDRPPKRGRQPKKSGGGQAALMVLLVLVVVCGGAAGGVIWAVSSLWDKAADALARTTAAAPDDTRPADKGATGKQPAGEVEANNGLDLRFVANDFFIGAVVNVPGVLKSPVIAPAVPPDAIEAAKKETGFDLRKLERVVILGNLPPPGEEPLSPAVILGFSEPVDGKAIMHKAIRDVGEGSFEGKSYLLAKASKPTTPPDAGYVADDRTVVIAPEPTLRKMLAAKGDGPLAAQMRHLDLKADVSAAFVMGPVRQAASDFLKAAKDGLPPDLAEVDTVPDRLKSGRLELHLEGDTLLKTTLEAYDDGSAVALEKLLLRGHDFLKQVYPALRTDLGKSLPPDSSKAVMGVVDQLPQSASISRSGKQVTVVVKTPKGLAGLRPALAPLLPGGGGAAKPDAPKP